VCAVGHTLHAAADYSIVLPPRGDWMTAVHVDGGLRAVLSGAVLGGAATPMGKSAHAVYTVSQKNVPPLTCYNLYVHGSIAT